MGKANELVRSMLAQRAGRADIGAVLDALWDQFGGATGIATESKSQYDAAKDGSSAKLQMLTTLIQQMGHMQARESKNAKPDDKDVSPTEIAAALQHFMETQNGTVTDPPTGLRQAAEPGGDQPGAAAERSGDDPEKYQG